MPLTDGPLGATIARKTDLWNVTSLLTDRRAKGERSRSKRRCDFWFTLKVIVKLSADLGLVRRQNPTLMDTKGLEMTLRSQLWLFEKA
jgi:hypothetical protein